ncbi:MAG: Gfo/Idh/MocA family oxidoreductase [Acidobacteria bacterium]|nr:Gfo/Idh/MocA family oxidoreductase [Acidobacteriota bacterium]
MKSRRKFIQDLSGGLTATLAASSITRADNLPQSTKPIRIGIIGAENSHTITYGQIFNRDRKFPDCEVVGVWGETAEFAKNAAEKGHIPLIVKDPAEFKGKIDALIVDHRHAKYHLDAARPFVEAGIPTFIDKPFCYRVSEGRAFLAMARAKKTPVSSFSTVARGEVVNDLKAQVKALTGIQHVISCGHCDVDSPYGGVFFYGIHQVQKLMEIFGENVVKTRVARKDADASATLVFASGLQATLVLAKGRPPFELAIVTDKGLQKLESKVTEDPLTPYREVVQLFREGKEPRSHESLLKEVAILEAMERSVTSDRWESVTSE